MVITNDKLMEILERTLGMPIGKDNIYYIQDVGVKKQGSLYFDSETMYIYECLVENSDITIIQSKYKPMFLKNTDGYVDAVIGTNRGNVRFIQDEGTKDKNIVYIDKNNFNLYLCIQTTDTTNNTGEFFKSFNVNHAFNRMDRLDQYGNIPMFGEPPSDGLANGAWYRININGEQLGRFQGYILVETVGSAYAPTYDKIGVNVGWDDFSAKCVRIEGAHASYLTEVAVVAEITSQQGASALWVRLNAAKPSGRPRVFLRDKFGRFLSIYLTREDPPANSKKFAMAMA